MLKFLIDLPRFYALSAALLLAGCSSADVQETLGMEREAPDEFVVVARPPLSVPPDFTLVPPQEGEENAVNGVATEEEARKLLLGTGGEASALNGLRVPAPEHAQVPLAGPSFASPSAARFLTKLGADQADPNIRAQLLQERLKPETVKKPVKESASLYEEWLGIDEEEPEVDPAKESERIRANKQAGKPMTEGETPLRDTKPTSPLDAIF